MAKNKKPKYKIPEGRFYKITVVFTKINDAGRYGKFNYHSPIDKLIVLDIQKSRWQMFRTLIHEFFHCAIDIFQHPRGKFVATKKEESVVAKAEQAAAGELIHFNKRYKVTDA